MGLSNQEKLEHLLEAARGDIEDLESGIEEGFYSDCPHNRKRLKMYREALTYQPEPVRVWAHISGGLIEWIHADNPVQFRVSDGDINEECFDITFDTDKRKVYAQEHIVDLRPASVALKYREFEEQLPF